MERATFTSPQYDAARLEDRLGTRAAFAEARERMTAAIAARDDGATDHWCEVSLLVVDAWKACPVAAA